MMILHRSAPNRSPWSMASASQIGFLVTKILEKYQDPLISAFEDDYGVVPIRVKVLLNLKVIIWQNQAKNVNDFRVILACCQAAG